MFGKTKIKVGLFLILGGVFCALLLPTSANAVAGTNQQLNFEGKVVKSDGTNLADGTYNMEFKVYQDGTSAGVGSSLKWTEDYVVAGSTGMPVTGGVTVSGGTFQVNLGSICALSGGTCGSKTNTGIDFNQQTLWLSFQVGNATSCTVAAGVTSFNTACGGDGEMTPYIRLTAVPQALNSLTVGGLTSGQLVQLAPSGQQTGVVNVSGNITSGGIIQGNTIDAATASTALAVGTTNANAINLNQNTALATGKTLTVSATGSISTPTITSTGALSIQSGGATALSLDSASAGGSVVLGTNASTLTIGTGTAAETVNIGISSGVDTINIGTAAGNDIANLLTGSGSATLNIGSSTTLTNILGGVAIGGATPASNIGLNIKPSGTSASGLVISGATSQVFTLALIKGGATPTTSADMLQFQNNAGIVLSKFDYQGNLQLGNVTSTAGAGKSGTLAFADGTVDNFSALLQSGTLLNSYSLALPVSGATGNTCLQSTSGSTSSVTALQFGSCGAGGGATTSLNNVAATSISADLTFAQGSNRALNFAQAASGTGNNLTLTAGQGATTGNQTGGNLVLSGGAGGGSGTTGSVVIKANVTNSMAAFQVQDASGAQLLNIDSVAQHVTIGNANGTPAGQLYVGGNFTSTAVIKYSALLDATNGKGPHDLTTQGAYTYIVATSSKTILSYDNTVPTAPVLVNTFSIGGTSVPFKLVMNGRYGYLSDTGADNVIRVIDFSNPAAPSLVTTVSTSINGAVGQEGITVQGRYLYVSMKQGVYLETFDLANPAAPKRVGYYTGGVASGATTIGDPAVSFESVDLIAVQGKYAYLSSVSDDTLRIYDVSNPASPTQVSSTHVTGTTNSFTNIAAQGKYVYSIDNSGYYHAIDISNPSSPSQLQLYNTSSGGDNTIVIQGHYLYASAYFTGVQVYDISNPTAVPVAVTVLPRGTGANNAQSFRVSGRYAYGISDGVSNDGTAGTYTVYDLGGAYISQLEAGGINTSTLNAAGMVDIGGQTTLQGSFTVAGTSSFNNDLSVSGNVLLQSSTNSTTSFQVQTSSGASLFTVNTSANQVQVSAPTPPTSDQFAISNAGQAVTVAGVNGLSINYVGGAAAVEASGARVDLTPGTTSGGTWNGMRIVANATGAVTGVTENGLKLDGPTTPGAGNEYGITIGTGWDAALNIATVTAEPATPAANTLNVYAKKISGRAMLKGMGPSGVDFAYQPSLFQQSIFLCTLTTVSTLVGQGGPCTAVASVTAAVTTTEASGVNVNYKTSAVAGNGAGVWQAVSNYFRGSVTNGSNGFFFFTRFGTTTTVGYGAGATGSRFFMGMSDQTLSTTMVGADNPNGNYAGLQYSTNRGDTNWMCVTKDNTTQSTPVSTGVAFAAGKQYDTYVYTPPKGTTIYMRIDNNTDGTTGECTMSTNLPVATTALRPNAFVGPVLTTARDFNFQRMYVETDR
jgi:hypothetical protein